MNVRNNSKNWFPSVKVRMSNVQIVKAKIPINWFQHLPPLGEVPAAVHLLPAEVEADILPEDKNIPAVGGI
jgi:hypothetical protein